jgi:hypothetical protein
VAGHVTVINAKDLFPLWHLPNLNVYTDLMLTEHMKVLVLENIKTALRKCLGISHVTCVSGSQIRDGEVGDRTPRK